MATAAGQHRAWRGWASTGFVCLIGVALWAAFLALPAPGLARSEYERMHGKFLRGASPPGAPFRTHVEYHPHVGLADGPGDVDVLRFRSDMSQIIPMTDHFALSGGVRFGVRDYSFSSAAAGRDVTLYEIAPVVGLHYFPTDDLFVSVSFKPGVSSDLSRSVEGDDWQFRGLALAIYRVSDSFYLKAGLALDEDFEQTPVIGLAGFVWRPTRGLRIDAFLPRHFTLSWKPAKSVPFYIEPGAWLEGERYNLNGAGAGAVQLQDIRVGLSLRYVIGRKLEVSLTAGSKVRGRFDVEVPGQPDQSLHHDPSGYVGVGTALRF